MIAVIGSQAIDIKRKSVDIDIVGSVAACNKFARKNLNTILEQYPSTSGKKIIYKGDGCIIPNSNIIEAEITKRGSSADKLFKLIMADHSTRFKDGIAYASLDVCYMLKMSHRFRKNSVHFHKTMRDILVMRSLGAVIRDEHREFFKEREKETYTYSHPKLNKGKAQFFSGDGVNYVYDHDSIHESVKIMDKPAYTFFQAENEEVMCDMNKFFELPQEIRLNAVCEESMVLAIERAVVPYNVPYKRAYTMALEKVCTSITSGRFREFAWENYQGVLGRYNASYFDKFFKDVENGKVDRAQKIS
jgi:hypothetical protein